MNKLDKRCSSGDNDAILPIPMNWGYKQVFIYSHFYPRYSNLFLDPRFYYSLLWNHEEMSFPIEVISTEELKSKWPFPYDSLIRYVRSAFIYLIL